jgi:hypothetical protein
MPPIWAESGGDQRAGTTRFWGEQDGSLGAKIFSQGSVPPALKRVPEDGVHSRHMFIALNAYFP